MSDKKLRYYVRREDDGTVSQLSRIITDESGLWGQYWRAGQWHDNDSVLDYLTSGDGDPIEESDAQSLIAAINGASLALDPAALTTALESREPNRVRGVIATRVDDTCSLLLGCDLRGADLTAVDLRRTRLVGCFLSGASFARARLDGAQIVACFAPQDWAPVDIGVLPPDGLSVRDCHLFVRPETALFASRWPEPAVVAAKLLTSDHAEDRNRALRSFAELQFVTAAPLLAYALEDGEWDVRLSALTTLFALRGDAFPSDDRALLEWMFYALGDETQFVSDYVLAQIAAVRPDDALLRAAIEQVHGPEDADRLAGLRAARRLVYADRAYLRLVDLAAIESLVRDATIDVRVEAMRLAGYLGGDEGLRLTLVGIADAAPRVRTAALSTVALLDERPHALQLARLLGDPDEDVRAATVYALNQCADFSAGVLTRAAHDASSKVREAVAAVLADRSAST